MITQKSCLGKKQKIPPKLHLQHILLPLSKLHLPVKCVFLESMHLKKIIELGYQISDLAIKYRPDPSCISTWGLTQKCLESVIVTLSVGKSPAGDPSRTTRVLTQDANRYTMATSNENLLLQIKKEAKKMPPYTAFANKVCLIGVWALFYSGILFWQIILTSQKKLRRKKAKKCSLKLHLHQILLPLF